MPPASLKVEEIAERDVSETPDDGRDDEEWKRIMNDLTAAAEAGAEPDMPDPGSAGEEMRSQAKLPDLDKSLEKIPKSSRELIDELFRGHFVGMKAIDREKLY
ncbi:MAG TPA: hypothetical protein VK041_07125 [Opitutales bacterium]|nr:hypothetical protein [Opitutales bacterium]